MTHTVIIDEAFRDRLMSNEVNKAVRHCRIGRVKPKQPGIAEVSFHDMVLRLDREKRPSAPWVQKYDDDWWRLPVVPTRYGNGTGDAAFPLRTVMM